MSRTWTSPQLGDAGNIVEEGSRFDVAVSLDGEGVESGSGGLEFEDFGMRNHGVDAIWYAGRVGQRGGESGEEEEKETGVWNYCDVRILMQGVDETGLKELLLADGVIRDRTARLTPLSGGVSSEIYLVEDGSERFVVKRALPKLKVQQDWFADVGRNANEAAYIRYVAQFSPDNVPRLRAGDTERGYFCMEYLGASFANWKQVMLDGRMAPEIATAAGSLLGTIHARSAGDAEARERFQTVENFEQLRIEPYLLATARRHPEFRDLLEEEAARLRRARSVLAHGDFSPKNILVSPERLVLVDCEVAWYGDAAFDVAFLLCHLFLKPLAGPGLRGAWRAMVEAAWGGYCTARLTGLESLEATVSHLLLMLLLARVDGKSPVEYLDTAQQDEVRRFVVRRLQGGEVGLRTLTKEWLAE